MSTFYTHDDKQSGDGLAITDWNELSNAVAGEQGLHLALDDYKVGIGTTNPMHKLQVNGNAMIGELGETLKIGNIGHQSWAGIAHTSRATTSDYALIQNSDGTTILNSKSSQTLHFRQGDGDKMVIKNGNVGIGTTTNLNEKLEVSGKVKATHFIGNGASLTDLNAIKITTGTLAVARIPNLNASKITTGTLAVARIPNLDASKMTTGQLAVDRLPDGIVVASGGNTTFIGNVGIGTSNPEEKLHVNGTLRLEGAMGQFEYSGDDSDYAERKEYIQFVKTDGVHDGARLYAEGGNDKGKLVLGFGNNINADEAFIIRGEKYDGSTREIATFRGDGNVGIGTSSPSAKLHISSGTSGDAILLLEADTDNNKESDNPMIQLRQDESTVGVNIGFDDANFGSNKFGIGRRWNNDYYDTFIIDPANGNVGIGTNSPSAKLQVSGTIKCTTLTQTSDQNLKANIQPLDQGLQALMNYKPVSYHWKKEDANNKRNYGFLAQDMQSLHADTSIVSGSEEDHGLAISYTQLIPVLTKSIQELSGKFKNDIEKLTKKVDALAKKVK